MNIKKFKNAVLFLTILFNVVLLYNLYLKQTPYQTAGIVNEPYSIDLSNAIEAIELIDENAIYASTNKWELKKKDSLEKLINAKSSAEIIRIIGSANAAVSGINAFVYAGFKPAIKHGIHKSITNYNPPKYHVEDNILVFDSLGTPGMNYSDYNYFDLNNDFCNDYIEEIHSILYENSHVDGIVIDNSFWQDINYSTAIAAMAPVLPNGRVFEFLDKNENVKGGIVIDDEIVTNYLEDETKVYKSKKYLGKLKKPLMIIVTSHARDNEELFTLAFKDLPQVLLYGQNTSGQMIRMTEFLIGKNVYMTSLTRSVRNRKDEIFSEDCIKVDVKDNSSIFDLSENGLKHAKTWFSKTNRKDFKNKI